MICNAIGLTADSFESIYVTGGAEVAEVYGGLNYVDPIFYKTQTMTGTAPLVFDAYPGSLKLYTISGDTVQNGTPTPEAPVDVVGCGVRTGNLFDIDNALENYYLINGVPTSLTIGGYVLSDYIPIASNTAIISAKVSKVIYYGAHWAVYDENKTYIRGGIAFDAQQAGSKVKVVDASGAAFIRVDYSTECLTDCMLNLGSTALPYEPYGYKLPLTINGTEYPIYLGQVPTTRRIKKLVLTGEEVYISKDRPDAENYMYVLRFYHEKTICFCSHLQHTTAYPRTFKGINSNQSYNLNYMCIGPELQNAQPSGNTVEGFKEYLAAQYAAGTPVTIWYVLAEPEAGIVNEPLHKIGDYADIITMAQAGETIPTIAGSNTLSIGTTLPPSQVSITGHIKPSSIYGNLTDVNGTYIKDKDGVQIKVTG